MTGAQPPAQPALPGGIGAGSSAKVTYRGPVVPGIAELFGLTSTIPGHPKNKKVGWGNLSTAFQQTPAQNIPGVAGHWEQAYGGNGKALYGKDGTPTQVWVEGSSVGHPTEMTQQQATAYFSGLQKTNPALLAKIQDEMWRAGYYGDTHASGSRPLYGVIRPQDVQAFQDVMKISTGNGMDIGQYLGDAAKTADKLGVKAVKPVQRDYANKETPVVTLEAAANQAFEAALGREPTAKERGAFVANFQQQQYASLKSQYDAADAQRQAAAAGGTADNADLIASGASPKLTSGDAGQVARNQAVSANPGQYLGHGMSRAAQDMLAFLQGQGAQQSGTGGLGE